MREDSAEKQRNRVLAERALPRMSAEQEQKWEMAMELEPELGVTLAEEAGLFLELYQREQ